MEQVGNHLGHGLDRLLGAGATPIGKLLTRKFVSSAKLNVAGVALHQQLQTLSGLMGTRPQPDDSRIVIVQTWHWDETEQTASTVEGGKAAKNLTVSCMAQRGHLHVFRCQAAPGSASSADGPSAADSGSSSRQESSPALFSQDLVAPLLQLQDLTAATLSAALERWMPLTSACRHGAAHMCELFGGMHVAVAALFPVCVGAVQRNAKLRRPLAEGAWIKALIFIADSAAANLKAADLFWGRPA